jgi:hypothetical protein
MRHYLTNYAFKLGAHLHLTLTRKAAAFMDFEPP